MTLRLLTETGFLGFMVFVFFVLKYKIRSKAFFYAGRGSALIINAGIFVMIVLILIRSGHYTVHGRVLFSSTLLLFLQLHKACERRSSYRPSPFVAEAHSPFLNDCPLELSDEQYARLTIYALVKDRSLIPVTNTHINSHRA